MVEVLRSGSLVDDRCFDAFLPEPLRFLSGRFLTPVRIAHRAARWFAEAGVRAVLDAGCGPGKFCVLGSLFTSLPFCGIEQRAHLAAAGQALAVQFDVSRRARIVHGRLDVGSFVGFDGLYFFNPFVESCLLDGDWRAAWRERDVPEDVRVAEEALARAPLGVSVITYNGFGGRFPNGYRRINVCYEDDLEMWRRDESRG
jgi:hypothetical protein